MKKLFKFFPLALAAFALASCSSDEFDSINANAEQAVAQKGDLRISYDPFDNEDGTVTRAYADKLFGTRTYEDGDKIYVYDEDMHATDIYAYDADENGFYFEPQFTGDKKQIEGEPSFAVYAGVVNKNPKGYVLRSEEGTPTCVDIKLPHVLEYKETVIDGTPMYGFEYPAFGAASYNDDPSDPYIKVDNYRYLTALLRVKLENAFGNVSFIRVSNAGPDGTYNVGKMEDSKPLSGNLTAKLYKGDDRKNSKLEVVDEDYLVYPEVYIDLRNVPSSTSFIYIPIIPGLDGDVDHIKLEYTANRNISDVESEKDDNGVDIAWAAIPGMQFPGVEFKANWRYAGSYSYELTDMNPKKVSDLLNQYKASSQDIVLNVKKTFTINAAEPTIDNIIYVPAFENNINVTINLADGFTTWTKTGSLALRIQDLDPANPFKGTITFNYGAAIKSATASDANVHVDLAEGKAIIAGEFDNTQKINPISGNIQLGDGTTTTSGIVWGSDGIGEKVKSIKIAENATLADHIDASAAANETAKITVAGEMTGNITTSAAAEEVTVSGKLTGNINAANRIKAIAVNVSGEMEGDIVVGAATTEANKNTINISGKLKQSTTAITSGTGAYFTDVNVSGIVDGNLELTTAVKGTLDITTAAETADTKVITGDVTTAGDVKVELAAEGEAIAGKLTMLGCNKTLTLKQGYINEINSNVSSGEWEKPFINITFDDANGLVAFNTLKTLDDKNEIIYNKSTWCGKKITNTTYANKVTVYDNKQAKEDLKTSSYAVFTAAQLATLSKPTHVRLYNDIDLNGAQSSDAGHDKWASIDEVTNSFWGNNHTISNMNLQNGGAFGLIKEAKTTTLIKDLVINGVTGDFTNRKNVGVLLGQNNTDNATGLKISGITVKNLTLADHVHEANKTVENIGGLVGNSSMKLSLEGNSVSGKIVGYSALGGLVGSISADITIATCTTDVTIESLLYQTEVMNVNYAKVGGFIGTSTAGSAKVTLDATTGCKVTFTQANNITDKMYISDNTAGQGNFYQYNRVENFIGYCGAHTLQNPNTVGDIKIGSDTTPYTPGDCLATTPSSTAHLISYMLKK